MGSESPRISEFLTFSPEEGKITFQGRRMVILEAAGMGILRRELIRTLGDEMTRGLLFRFGFAFGANDAESLRRSRKFSTPREWWEAGPPMRAMEGIAAVLPKRVVFEPDEARFEAELVLRNSHEAENMQHLSGKSDEPVCWFMAGFASGHATACFGRRVIFIEERCAARDDGDCLLVGRRAEDWGERARAYLKYLEGESVGQIIDSMKTELKSLRAEVEARCSFSNIVGRSAAMVEVLELTCEVARTESTVLLLGESGTGKELLARAIHHNSRRAGGPFVAVNCAAIHDTLLESELFGHEKGAFTGADKTKPGKFERAAGGTLFLDEIGDMNPALQAKVLRVLQEKEFERVGGTHLLRADVRIVAATNRELMALIRERKFREDLFYRISGFPVTIPPLRERPEDVRPLAQHFLKAFCAESGRPPPGISEAARKILEVHPWPGNVRELQNVIERAAILSRDEEIQPTHLGIKPNPAFRSPSSGDSFRLPSEGVSIERVERSLIEQAIMAAGQNKTAAAKLLGLSRSALRYRLEKFGLDR